MSEWRFKLLFDGQCPMCRREVQWLQRRNRKGYLAFEDISAPDFDPSRHGVNRDELMDVMHGVFPDGRIVREVEVFRQAYRQVGLGWLLAPTAWPGLRWISGWGYRLFARHRLSLGRFLGGGRCHGGACSTKSNPSPTPKQQ